MFVAEYRNTMKNAKFHRTAPIVEVEVIPIPKAVAWPEPIHKRLKMPAWAAVIVYESAARYEVTAEDVMSESRRVPVVDARAEAMYLLYEMRAKWPWISTTKIGGWFNRDFTSVAHLISRHAEEFGLPRLAGNYTKTQARHAERSALYRRTQEAGGS